MRGEENTSQAASVEFVRRRRTNYARSRLQPLCQKVILFDRIKPPLNMSGGFLRGGMKKQSGMFHAGLLHPIGAQCPGSPPCCTDDLRSSIGT